ncbi:SDR family NAD(P)-dependent oxidoreductase [Pararhizobium qamdonense]|uniref:SDR family NAD(P)-dependent oxidoreductase n=1 Tax=Pararhizobium qamdonense TaxID=3031126 RepID=UPI0023E18507|nr:SDR family NAD(P)-dependent oxidoreductase [Pararhizobium qamdonense]
MDSLGGAYKATIIGSTGGIGHALADVLEEDPNCAVVVRLSRSQTGFDLGDEASIERAAAGIKDAHGDMDLVFDATGALEIDGTGPEKSLRAIDPAVMARQFAVNAIGPALILKHFSPLMPRARRALLATLSARVGSIGDNRLGGWISYRAAKAALNQIVKTASIEIARTHPQAIVTALHPGTVATALTAPFRHGEAIAPIDAARQLLGVLDHLQSASTGGFFAYDGQAVDW